MLSSVARLLTLGDWCNILHFLSYSTHRFGLIFEMWWNMLHLNKYYTVFLVS